MKNLLKSLTATRSATAEALDALDLLREGIAAKHGEIARIAAAPAPVEDTMAAFDGWMDSFATDAVDALRPGRLLAPGAAGQGLPLSGFPDGTRAAEVVLGLLIAVKRQAFTALVRGQIEDMTMGVETMSAATRQKKMDRARAELQEAEMLEETCIRALEQAGVMVARRPDASPGAVLASEDALPR